MSKILSWVCPVCGKEIRSIYERQLNQNIKAHQDKHQTDVDEKSGDGKQ